MLLINRNSGARELADPSLAIAANVNLTSSAVSSPRPPWNCTPLRKQKVQVRPPSAIFQRSASMGASSPVLGSRVRRFSYMGLRTTSSAPTYRWGSQRSLPKVATATVSVPTGAAARPSGAASTRATAAAQNSAVTSAVTIESRRLIAFLLVPEKAVAFRSVRDGCWEGSRYPTPRSLQTIVGPVSVHPVQVFLRRNGPGGELVLPRRVDTHLGGKNGLPLELVHILLGGR